MSGLSYVIRADKEYTEYKELLISELKKTEGSLPIAVNGLTGGAVAAFLAESIRDANSVSATRALVLASDEAEAIKLEAALLSEGLKVLRYKKRELVFHNISASHDAERERLSVLYAFLSGECDAVITTPSAAMGYTMPSDMLKAASATVEVGAVIPPEELTEKLTLLGYSSVDTVEASGQFSKRGGIVDFWGGESVRPIRVEFFGDEIDRMVYFDPISQRSEEPCGSALLVPAMEVIVDKAARDRIVKEIDRLLKDPTDESLEKLSRERSMSVAGLPLDFRDKYMGVIYEKPESLMTYASRESKCAVFAVGTNGCAEDAKRYAESIFSSRATLLERRLITERAAKYSEELSGYERFLSENIAVHINAFSGGAGASKLSGLFGFRTRRTVAYGDNGRMLIDDLKSYRKSLYRTLILCENKAGADSLTEALNGNELPCVPVYAMVEGFDITKAAGGGIFVGVGKCEGYELITPLIAVLSMARDEGKAIMQNRRRQRLLKKYGNAGQRLMSYADLSVGDYVVHTNYGIGLFEGIETVTVDGVTKDYITIRYAGTDKLFVPCDRLEMIGKYIGDRDKDGGVKLSKMGGTEWARTRARAKSAAKDIARDLIALYAARQKLPGFAFPPDSELEDEFAAAFEYEETESQTVAIKEIKADMMRPVPMNRLLCGDVGFGKTEVALRAAFKAIMGGKQVAILVPTTILAMQHYQTVLSRMRGYPVTVDMLSRFRTPKEQKAIMERVKCGKCDVLIGTHKLFSKSLEFKNLGLLIIDEEQRFGVAQKEKLKEIAKNVDVLTLSATPIPRTLNMAMNGISDMSVLDEAPGERRPVQTYVMEHDEGVLFDAMKRELDRRGQVLYLYNKVETIDLVAGRIMRALPEARVAFAHGKMDKDDLEDIWQGLVSGEIDILVCTTIIETGVDLPSANTLIIENADHFGLAQLHQIRGRVGRSERQAYAYFTYKVGKALSEVAEKRLEAIREYAEFGAGFKIALRDLEIRGAGNLLGAEQHGYIESVGYDLYVKMLNEAVLEETGAVKAEKPEAVIDIRTNAHIPENYIQGSAGRMEMYKKISLITSPEDMRDVADEFMDRFGDMPKVTQRLLNVSLTRAIATEAGISKVFVKDMTLTFVLDKLRVELWADVLDKHKQIGMRATDPPLIIYRLKPGEDPTSAAAEVMTDYYALMKSETQELDALKDEKG